MRNYKIILFLLIVAIFLLSGIKERKKVKVHPEDEWSGTVSYFEKITGPKIVINEWHMDATITNNKGTATNKMKSEVIDEGKSECHGQDSSELDVGIDPEKKIYSIFVTIPDCNGLTIDASGRETKYVQDGSIMINDRPLGANHDILSGKLILKDSFPNGSKTVTTYTWNLTRTR